MTHDEVMSMMDEMKIPYAYHHFAEGESPDPPFMVFLYPGADNFSADGVPYYKIKRLEVEVYTDLKDIKLEDRVESVLEKHETFYSKSETWIESEKLYEVLYEMEV